MNCDNIASKNFQLSQKKSNPLVQSIIPSYYRIALSLRINIAKCLRWDCHSWSELFDSIRLPK